jgi:hypothetical protein
MKREMSSKIELDECIEFAGDYLDLLITLSVEGSYRPSTWGYNGGHPEEFPEAEILEVLWLRSDDDPIKVPEAWWPFSRIKTQSILDRAVDQAMKMEQEYGEDERDDRDE